MFDIRSNDTSANISGEANQTTSILLDEQSEAIEDALVKVVTQISAVLSIIGSLLIFAVYILLRNDSIKSTARPLVVCLTVADLLTAAGNLYGVSADYGGESTWDCIAQSFVTTFSSMSSFFWTSSLSIYLYIALVRLNMSQANHIIPLCHVVSWIVPLVLTLSALGMSALGNDEGSGCGSAGWCWIRKDIPDRIPWMIVTGKLWEVSAAIILPTVYFLTKKHIAAKHDKMEGRRLSKEVAKHKMDAVNCINRRFMAIPVLFVFLRMWGTIRTFLDFAGICNYGSVWSGLRIFHGFGDSFQGAVNCVIFCLMTERGKAFIKQLIWKKCPTNEISLSLTATKSQRHVDAQSLLPINNDRNNHAEHTQAHNNEEPSVASSNADNDLGFGRMRACQL